MPALLLGVVVLVLLLWALHAFAKADPHVTARVLKLSGGYGSLAGAAVFAPPRQVGICLPLGFAGLGLLGWLPFDIAGFGRRAQKSPGQVSRVRSAFVEMELAHDTGAMRGRILAGRHAGAELDALEFSALVDLLSEIDEESRAL